MTDESKDHRRSTLGYGSTYRKGQAGAGRHAEIQSVLGGQMWLVKPDKKAKAAHPCLWMSAGAVKFKNCTNFYDCSTCSYDHALAEKVKSGKQTSWQDAMRLRPEMHRVCRHSLTGRVAMRACAYHYECGSCDFDQLLEDVWAAKGASRPGEVQKIRGFDVPMDHYFHDGHTWARIESGGFIRIGLDDFALKLLGKADAFELPLMGKELDQGRVGWGLKRRGQSADVLSPVGGVITEVNPRVRENAGLANREPYGDGWLFTVSTPDVKATITPLMTDQQGMRWMVGEVDRLEQMVEEVAGPLAADGGFLTEDIYGNLPGLGWGRLAQAFLKTG
jgi:glycine cleavage system H lipoate-binding protein